MEKSKHKLPQVWVKPVQPEEYPGFSRRKVKPVTRGDLDHKLQTGALRGFRLDHAPVAPPQHFKVVNIDQTLDLWTKTYDFGSVVWPMWQFLFAENWKEVIDELAVRKLYLFDIWGYCPSGPFDKFEWSEYRVSDEKHRYILEKLGPLFLGYDNGEQDGRYIGGYAKLVCPAPATRQQGHEAFCEYFKQLGNDLQNYLIALNSLTFPHYFAALGNHRMLGAETAQALPSVPMWYAFIRGAGRQYGILWYGNASVWNRWGYKSLADPNAPDSHASGSWMGPTSGTSMSLLRRLWYVLAMYGSVLMDYESGELGNAHEEKMVNGKKQQVPVLTDIGKEQLKGSHWCINHSDRGELHTPVALLWDFYSGWAPPRHLYTNDTYLVWGNMPYAKGDHQIDLILRELYPNYPDAGFFHNEQGFLPATPCGDIFDVLLSDAPDEILNRYECIVLLGETILEGELLHKLHNYTAQGGNLVACANQLGAGAHELFGVQAGKKQESHDAVIPGAPWPINETPFQMHLLTCAPDAQVIARTWHGAPLAVRRETSGGSTLLFAAEFGLTDQLLSREKIVNSVDEPLLSPYALLEHVRAILLPYLRSFNLVTVEGPPIQYMVNVTERTDRLVVTLCNNSPQPWEGAVKPNRSQIRSAANWMTDKSLPGGSSLHLQVPPLDVAVIELLLDGAEFVAKK